MGIFQIGIGMFKGPEEIKHILTIADKQKYYSVISRSVSISGVWVECGVGVGTSAREILKHLPKNTNFHLFDSFEGLPEKWEWDNFGKNPHPKGTFACDVPNFNDDRIIIHKGWFDDTLPKLQLKSPIALLHIDSDLYSSCVSVLKYLGKYIVSGTIILFDEYQGYNLWMDDEYKAFKEFNRSFVYLARTLQHQCAVRITE